MSDDLATTYGEAIYLIGKAEGVEDRVANELHTFAMAVDADNELRTKLTDPSVPVATRAAATDQILQRAHEATRSVVQLLLSSGRIRSITSIAKAVADTAAVARGASVALVRTAKPLADAQRNALVTALSKREGRAIDLKVVEDPSLLGGIVIQVGDTVLDGSALARLTDLKTAIAR